MEVNYLSLLLAAAASMGVGMFWYSPLAFGAEWMKQMGYTKKSMEKMMEEEDMRVTYASSFLAALIQAYVLNYVFVLTETYTMSAAIILAVVLWFGFIATTQLSRVLWGKDSVQLFTINTLHQVAQIAVMAIVLMLFR